MSNPLEKVQLAGVENYVAAVDMTRFIPAGTTQVYSDGSGVVAELLTLPTEQPSVPGQLWWNSGFLCRS